jgi:hypothetical protein
VLVVTTIEKFRREYTIQKKKHATDPLAHESDSHTKNIKPDDIPLSSRHCWYDLLTSPAS